MDVTDLPEMTKSGVDAETEIVGGRADDMSRVLTDRERFDFGQRTSGLALADIDYQAGTVSLDAVGAQLYGFGKGPVTVSRDEIHVRFHPDDRERLAKEISLSLDPSDGGTLDTEHRIVLPDGTQRWLRVQKRIDFASADRKRRPDRGILAALDITERKESELRLRNSEERLLLAQKAAGIGVWDVDLENKQTVWSEGLYDLMQIERGTPPSPDLFFKYVHPDDEPGLRDAFNCAIRDVSSFKSDFRVVLPDGTLRYFVGQGTVTSEHEGYARRIVGVNYDVTDLKTAELRLRESEAQLRLILDETAGIVGILDVDGTLREANRAALEAGDITREDVIGMPLWDASWWLHDPDEVARVKEAVARAAAGETVRYDAQIAAGGGRLRTIDFNLSPVRNANGEVTLLVPSALDITERKQAETRLAEREAQLALFVQHAPTAIAMFDRDMRYVAYSDRYVIDYHLPDDIDLVGRSYYDVNPNFTDGCRGLNERVIKGETVSAEEEYFTLPDGTPEWLRWKMAPWYDAAGDIGGAILFSEVITEQLQARRALKESEARYKALFESIDAGFCVVEVKLDEPDGQVDYRVVEANPAFYDSTGFPREILGAWLRKAAPDLEEHWYEIYGGIARTGEPARFEEHSELLDRWFDVFAFRIDEPEDCRVAILFHDISDRKRHEDHVSILLKEVNHRSKNMLALINVIAQRTTGEGHADFISKFSDRLAALAANQDILVLSDWAPVELERLVRSQLAHFGDLLDRRIHIEGPALTVFPGAAERLGMALHELGTNASKYGALSNNGGSVHITWQIRPEDVAPEFTLQWREEGGPAVRAPKRKGFGSVISGDVLGSQLEGTVTADYRSEGLVWSLSCPWASLTEAVDAPPDAPSVSSAPHVDGNGVLVLDDDPLLALSVAEALRDAGFDVIGPAHNADGAMEMIAGARPDMAILDVNLGRETSERVAVELQRLGVPFLCMSAYSAAQIPEPLRNAPFLGKPLDVGLLLEAVRSGSKNLASSKK
ncbi:MAG: PAS domain-containing protein [Rhodobacteraceae bacterium]|nr:PAS domain-containing protein [Paracoccaceae bacterium]